MPLTQASLGVCGARRVDAAVAGLLGPRISSTVARAAGWVGERPISRAAAACSGSTSTSAGRSPDPSARWRHGRPGAPRRSLGRDPCLQLRVLPPQQVARRDVGRGRVTGEQPGEHLGSGHDLIVAGRASARATLGWSACQTRPVRSSPADPAPSDPAPADPQDALLEQLAALTDLPDVRERAEPRGRRARGCGSTRRCAGASPRPRPSRGCAVRRRARPSTAPSSPSTSCASS